MLEALSFGKPDGSHLERPNYTTDKDVEIVDGTWDRFACPLPPFGLTKGTGYPARLIDGLFLAATTSPFDPGAASTSPLPLYGTGTLHGKDFYDYAVDGDRPLYMVFTARRLSVAGADRAYPYQLDSSFAAVEYASGTQTGQPKINPDYNPGEFGSESVTGLRGNFRVWFSNLHIGPTEDITTYAVGDFLTVEKGLLVKFNPSAVDKRLVVKIDKVFTANGVTKFRGWVDLAAEVIR